MANAKAQRTGVEGFEALADPTRRAIFEKLSAAPAAVGELAQGLPVTRPAVSQHLRVLEEAGLVAKTAQGARRIYRIDPRGIGAMRAWLDDHWGTAMTAFARFADAETEREEGEGS
jgi:DNA-binding transcriptional ArsR family regulator